MRLLPTPLVGAVVVRIDRHEDARGYFARVWCREELETAEIPANFVQSSISHNLRAGTVRGMHFAWPPAREAKLVRCERGAVYDVIVDLRPDSPTFVEHFAVELSADNGDGLYIPPGLAHGFQTLVDGTTVGYAMTEPYVSARAGGFRYDDPAFGIRWPRAVSCVIERDRNYPNFNAETYCARYAASGSE